MVQFGDLNFRHLIIEHGKTIAINLATTTATSAEMHQQVCWHKR